jgi:hypothetical protein
MRKSGTSSEATCVADRDGDRVPHPDGEQRPPRHHRRPRRQHLVHELFAKQISRLELRATVTVTIQIKPLAVPPVPTNLSSAGVVPVAILSSATFDATQVDPTVLLAGASRI